MDWQRCRHIIRWHHLAPPSCDPLPTIFPCLPAITPSTPPHPPLVQDIPNHEHFGLPMTTFSWPCSFIYTSFFVFFCLLREKALTRTQNTPVRVVPFPAEETKCEFRAWSECERVRGRVVGVRAARWPRQFVGTQLEGEQGRLVCGDRRLHFPFPTHWS